MSDEAVVPPEGYRLLKPGEIIFQGDIYRRGKKKWCKVYDTSQPSFDTNIHKPIARKIKR